MMLVGITGHAQHGKDTIASVLVEEYGFVRIAFADALKSMALALDPWVIHRVPADDPGAIEPVRLSFVVETGGWESAKGITEVRRFLQVLGTEGVRGHLGEDSWLRAWQKTVDGIGVAVAGIVVPDVRFPNEADYIRYRSGELWEVMRPGFDNGVGTDHPSEQYIDELGATVGFMNMGTIDDLKDMVRERMGASV
jgi:hypothetical protein